MCALFNIGYCDFVTTQKTRYSNDSILPKYDHMQHLIKLLTLYKSLSQK